MWVCSEALRRRWWHWDTFHACRPLWSRKKATAVWAVSGEGDDLWADANVTASGGQRRHADGWKGVKLPLTGLLIHSGSVWLLRLPSVFGRTTQLGECVSDPIWLVTTAEDRVGEQHIIKSVMLAQCYRLLLLNVLRAADDQDLRAPPETLRHLQTVDVLQKKICSENNEDQSVCTVSKGMWENFWQWQSQME